MPAYSKKGIASVTASQIINRHQDILLFFCDHVKGLVHRIKTFQVNVCSCSPCQKEYITCTNVWPVMQQENQNVSVWTVYSDLIGAIS